MAGGEDVNLLAGTENMEDEDRASFGMKHVETKLPQNFTIPKIKRHIDKCCLLRCSPNRREFGEILDTLHNGRLNLFSELKSSWKFSDIKLVLNNYLTEKFFEKRNEMKELGRHGREVEDKFCFLVVPCQIAAHIAQHGLSVGYMKNKELGNPEMGVYLFRHIDVALNVARQKKMSSIVVLIFKVCFSQFLLSM
ncbi:protein TASOR-like [Ranitomeya imitator]|uniref:protein TASOR-like n=1 Tax=Ranitomeya imitator TaxID=111125 RepID=UPI0037E833AA